MSTFENIWNLVVPYSCDLSENNNYYLEKNCQTFHRNFTNHRPVEVAIVNSNQEKHKIIILFVKQFYNDIIDNETLFNCMLFQRILANFSMTKPVDLLEMSF